MLSEVSMSMTRNRAVSPPVARLHIDWTLCDGRGLCTELLPELLERDDWGYPLARTREREPGIPQYLMGHAKEAVTHCPLLALTVMST